MDRTQWTTTYVWESTPRYKSHPSEERPVRVGAAGRFALWIPSLSVLCHDLPLFLETKFAFKGNLSSEACHGMPMDSLDWHSSNLWPARGVLCTDDCKNHQLFLEKKEKETWAVTYNSTHSQHSWNTEPKIAPNCFSTKLPSPFQNPFTWQVEAARKATSTWVRLPRKCDRLHCKWMPQELIRVSPQQ